MKKFSLPLSAALLIMSALLSACSQGGPAGPAKSVNTLVDEGVRLMLEHEYARALADFDKAVSSAPNDAKAHFFRGSALSALGRKEDAIAEFDKSSSLAPEVPQPYFNKGNALAALGRNEDALAAYDAVIRREPKYVKAYSNKAVVLSKLGRLDEARAASERARALDPRALPRGLSLSDSE